MLHALAHIEFGAIDLAFDIVGRFGASFPRSFADDWIGVGADEAMHFALLDRRLKAMGSGYGALPAHDGLWEAAEATADDALARLAVVPMVLEARGLDVTPATVRALERPATSAPPRSWTASTGTRFGTSAPAPIGSNGAVKRGESRPLRSGNDWSAPGSGVPLSRRSTTQRGTKPVCPAISTAGWTWKDMFNSLGSTTRGGQLPVDIHEPERKRTGL
jgi:hypothetical protein